MIKIKRLFLRLVIVAACISSIGGAQAATITLNAINSPLTVGSLATFELWMDFTDDSTLGGGVDVLFDNFTNNNQLSFNSYTPEAIGDTSFINMPTLNLAGNRLEGITFGSFDGLKGSMLVGTLVFNTLVAGNYSLSLIDSLEAGGFSSITGANQAPDYISATLAVDPAIAAVPIPATGWLLLAGLAGLIGLSFITKSNRPQQIDMAVN